MARFKEKSAYICAAFFLGLASANQAAAPPNPEGAVLCKWCACGYDPSTWIVPEDPSSTTPAPDSDSLLVNCSGRFASPFAGAYEWPDVPHHHEDSQEESPDLPVVPATRADFSSCGLAGAVRKMPSVPLRKLRELSLASNSLSWVEADALVGLPSLELLDLSGNKLAKLSADALPLSSDANFASNLVYLRLSHNELMNVPWEALRRLPRLRRLHLGHNFIHSAEGYNGSSSDLIFNNIKVLNLTHNRLTNFKSSAAERFPGLQELDLSWNNLEAVPEAFLMPIGAAERLMTGLRALRLDGNPIKVLATESFVGAPALAVLSISSTDTLREVSVGAFDGLLELERLKLSGNPLLSRLPVEGLFGSARRSERWTVKEVDLSYNSLQTLGEDFLPWEEISVLDLQGNPWICNCNLQWMLDDLMPDLYKKDSGLLFDLRCAKPHWLMGRRFVHWLGRSEGIFCGKKSAALRHQDSEVEVVAMGMNTGMLTAVVAIAILVLGLMIAAVVLQRRGLKKEKELRSKNFMCRNPRY